MSSATSADCWIFPDLFSKPVVVQADQEMASSEGGAIFLGAADRRLKLLDALSGCVMDERQPGKVKHELGELLAQRVYAIACGYPDCNDAARLMNDPIQKLLVGRDPATGAALASQPTLSRFENSFSPRAIYRMGEALLDTVVEHHRRRLRGKSRRITIDLDPTDDPTHGGQQLTFFNGHYDTWCYLPVVGFLTFGEEKEQYLFTAVLRPGNSPATLGALGILKRTLGRLRESFPGAKLRVRLDGGFACPAVLRFLEAQGAEYVVAMAKNKVLERRAKKLMRQARKLSRQSERTEHVYGECQYAAKSWKKQKRRIVIKAEVVRHPGREPKDNPRFVITNLHQSPQWIYEKVYCARGEIENRIKELHHGLEMDRTSCSSFWANQLRVLMTAAAYVLMQELRIHAAKTAHSRAQVFTLREHLIKIGARLVVSARRIVIHLPRSFPHRESYHRLALALGATAG